MSRPDSYKCPECGHSMTVFADAIKCYHCGYSYERQT